MSDYDQVFVDVDTQVDFMTPAGKLYVPRAESMVPVLAALFEYARQTGIRVISSADCHTPDDPEFSQFPPHCVVGTAGQARIRQTLLPDHVVVEPDQEHLQMPALLAEHQQLIFNKRTFDLFDNPNAERLVKSISVGRYVVFGVATDYCVRAAAAGLLARGQQVIVVRDAVQAVGEDTGAAAAAELTGAGVRWCDSREIVQ